MRKVAKQRPDFFQFDFLAKGTLDFPCVDFLATVMQDFAVVSDVVPHKVLHYYCGESFVSSSLLLA